MRKINTEDVFKMARIIKKGNLKDSIIFMATKGKSVDTKDEESVKELGFELFFTLIDAATNAGVKDDLYDLLAGIYECTSEEVGLMSLDAQIERFKQLAKENNLLNFLSSASRLMP